MNRRRTYLIWSTWLVHQCLEWGAAVGLFFVVPWAHYQGSVAPRLEQIETVRSQLDQELRRLQQQNRWEHWEAWAGQAIVQIQAAVQTARNQLAQHPPLVATALDRLTAGQTYNPAATVSIHSEIMAAVAARAAGSPQPAAVAQPHAQPALKGGILLHLPHTGPEDILWTAVNEFYGVPYRFGGQDRFGMDCSALVQAVFARLQVDLPRTAQAQFDSRLGVYIGLDDLRPGDLVFFHTRPIPYVSHVGIYIGQGEFLHAPRRGRRVEIAALNDYYRSRFIAAKRLLADPFTPYQQG